MKGKVKTKKSVSQSDFKDALVKKALGYDCTEVVEEYVSGDEGEIRLTKKKVTKKNVPPDISAAKILLDNWGENSNDLSALSGELWASVLHPPCVRPLKRT